MEGLQVFNDGNTLTIDGNYSNLVLYQVGLVSSLPRPTNDQIARAINWDPNRQEYGLFRGTLPSSIVNPFISVELRKNQYTTPFNIFQRNDGSWQFDIFIGQGVNSTGMPLPNFNIKYYVFAEAGVVPDGNFGLQVFNDSGKKVFDSNTKYMNVVTTVPMSYFENGGIFPRQVLNINLPSNRTFAYMSGGRSGDMTLGYLIDSEGGFRQYEDWEDFSVAQISSDDKLALYQDEWHYQYSGASGGSARYILRNCAPLILDVTGY